MFNLKQTEVYNLVKKEKDFKIIKLFESICFFAFIIIAFILIYKLFQSTLPTKTLNLFEGVLLILFCCYLWLRSLIDFFETELKNPQTKTDLTTAIANPEANLADWLNFNSAKYLTASFKMAEQAKLSAPTPTILLYNFLDENNPKIVFLFSRLSLDLTSFRKSLAIAIEQGNSEASINFGSIIFEAANSSIKRQGTKIKEGDILAAIAEIEPNFNKILIDLEIGKEDIENVSWWIESINKKIKNRKAFGSYENLIKVGSIGSDLAFGYTITLDQFGIDWTNEIRLRGYEEIIGHAAEADLAEKVLTRKGPRNVLLVGEIGSDRKSIIHQIIKKSLLALANPELNNKRFVQLDIVALSTNISSAQETEAVINQCLNEAWV